MNREASAQLQELMSQIVKVFADCVAVVDAAADDEAERKYYRRSIGRILMAIHDDVLRRIHEQHPDLKPHELE